MTKRGEVSKVKDAQESKRGRGVREKFQVFKKFAREREKKKRDKRKTSLKNLHSLKLFLCLSLSRAKEGRSKKELVFIRFSPSLSAPVRALHSALSHRRSALISKKKEPSEKGTEKNKAFRSSKKKDGRRSVDAIAFGPAAVPGPCSPPRGASRRVHAPERALPGRAGQVGRGAADW